MRLDGIAAFGLDETSFLKATRAAPTRYVTGLVDLERGQLLDLVADRTRTAVAGWLHARSRDWLAQVGTVALDPWRGYATALVASLGHARVVVDHFHARGHESAACAATSEGGGDRPRDHPDWEAVGFLCHPGATSFPLTSQTHELSSSTISRPFRSETAIQTEPGVVTYGTILASRLRRAHHRPTIARHLGGSDGAWPGGCEQVRSHPSGRRGRCPPSREPDHRLRLGTTGWCA
jgi:hypothetical protein